MIRIPFLPILTLYMFFSSCQTKQDQKTDIKPLKVDSLVTQKDSTTKNYYSSQGDTINLGSFSVAILKCEDDFKPKDIYNIPENTFKSVFVKFLYLNNSNDSVIKIQPMKWFLVDPSGQRYYPENKGTGKVPPLNQTIVQPKESIIGWLTFKTPYHQSDFDAILASDTEYENVITIRIGILNGFRLGHM